MKATLHYAEGDVRVDFSRGIDLSTRIDFYGPQPNAFGIPRARSAPFKAGSFVGDTRRGGSVNCETFVLNPHGNGTHTECVGHIVDERVSVSSLLAQTILRATLISVYPEPIGTSHETYSAPHLPEDIVITARAIQNAIGDRSPVDALILRTLPNPVSKRVQHFSGHNPPFFSDEAMRLIAGFDIQHLLVDFPSVDREEDGGMLPNHHVFWGVELGSRVAPVDLAAKTITEMAFIPDELEDGAGVLTIQVPDLALDAAPSRPRFFRIESLAS